MLSLPFGRSILGSNSVFPRTCHPLVSSPAHCAMASTNVFTGCQANDFVHRPSCSLHCSAITFVKSCRLSTFCVASANRVMYSFNDSCGPWCIFSKTPLSSLSLIQWQNVVAKTFSKSPKVCVLLGRSVLYHTFKVCVLLVSC